jgi:hypothetical protein
MAKEKLLKKILFTPRFLMASVDLSASLRQRIFRFLRGK